MYNARRIGTAAAAIEKNAQLRLRKGGSRKLDKTWGILKYVIVGMMETVALGSMIGASIFLSSPGGTLAILLGLVVGVLGLVIYDGWKM